MYKYKWDLSTEKKKITPKIRLNTFTNLIHKEFLWLLPCSVFWQSLSVITGASRVCLKSGCLPEGRAASASAQGLLSPNPHRLSSSENKEGEKGKKKKRVVHQWELAQLIDKPHCTGEAAGAQSRHFTTGESSYALRKQCSFYSVSTN